LRRGFPEITFDIFPIRTRGDKDKTTPLSLREGSDFFTYEIEQALLNNRIDAAVHSAKDIAEDVPSELTIAALTRPLSRYDCLVSANHCTLDTLAPGSRVGTSSKSRKEALLRYRRDLIPKDIRGDIEQRLAQLDRGDFEAVIVAHAALIRLRLEKRIAQIIPLNIIEAHPLQGSLAVQIRRDRPDLRELFRRLDVR